MSHFLKQFTFIFSFLSIGLFLQAQQYTYDANKGKEGLIINSSKQEVINLSFNIHQFTLIEAEVDGENFNKVIFQESLVPGLEGAPELPFFSRSILIPDGAIPHLAIKSTQSEIIESINLAPNAPIPFDTQKSIKAKKGVQYQKNEFYPSSIASFEQSEIRGMQFLQIAISPFQFNAISKELMVHHNIEIEISLSQSKGTYGEDRFRSPFWDQILSDLTYNIDDIPAIDYSKRMNTTKEEGCEYLIVVPDNIDFLPWADTIKKFRNEQGIHTKIMTVDEIGGNDIENINSFFEEVYDNWDPVPSAVLLMADYSEDENGITSNSWTHPYEGTYISDNYYADVTGNNLPDFVFARMTGRSYEEFEVLVHKFVNYERNPPTLESFYNEPITALGWQTERWFQICSETVGGYMRTVLGKNPTRINAIYEGNPTIDPWSTASNTSSVLGYFGPNGLGYLPATPGELGNWTGGTETDVINALNAGAFILQHRDHGNYNGWGEPDFNTNNINSLTNADLLSHVFTINCQTGQFNEGENCFAEKFHRHENGGALSLTAPTQVSYSFVNDALVWGLYDNMWPDFMPDYGGNLIPERDFRPAFGVASGKYFLSSTNWASNSMKTITYRLFHHHGDAFNTVYTEVPIENPVAYEAGITTSTTNIQVSGENGSLIGLSVDGELISNGFIEDGIANLTIPNQNEGTIIKIVITKQNYYRHEGEILVVPSEGAYVMKTSYTINDETEDGIVAYNETVDLDFIVKNIGSADAENVIISLLTDDSYITITSSEYSVGNLSSGEEINITDAFSFNTSVDIPDNHNVEFTFSATDGNSIWESTFKIKVFAPSLEFSVISFEETEGNGNGYLDAGESATGIIEIKNNGHMKLPAGSISISPNSEFITLNSGNSNFEQIEIGETLAATFEIITDVSAPIGYIANIIFELDANPFTIQNELYFNIGIIVENWESENFDSFNWTNTGDFEWTIADNYTVDGDFSARSGEISDNQSSILSLEYELIADNEISFYLQVSSEENHDYLNFYIDDYLVSAWSGLVLFEQFMFPVTEGIHEFKWEYMKDETGESGLDAAWLDFIILPPGNPVILGNEDISSSKNNNLAQLYPNPISEVLNIKLKSEEEIEYRIFNTMGQLIESGSNSSSFIINTHLFKPTTYYIQLLNNKGDQQIIPFIKL
ncbi:MULTISPECIES: C25 family cysteine peptidase [unclassified Lentimicrobium]|uniref:C25 family cysteine peptidase n=1 Tax=unclassified Lentimicrobium TaxID=2677434 RepID=UPI001555CE63|nr:MULTISPECIES: C25 family cysteine peptidase [unclassified Lentimicrobium]NPD46761.1 T9SS type A sorting domain-containing protein [Lentimicrobium sp. S6]NPD85664.1 T9SS type A sorting domain-containing protein [Lentimicrobium sp. L6]